MNRAAIFDMDGLIIDSEPYWRQAEIECFGEIGLQLTEDDCRRTMGYRLNEVIDFWFVRHPWENCSKENLEHNIVNRVIELTQEYGSALPGVYQAIQLFNRMGFRLGVASSSPDRLITAVLNALELNSHFEVVHSAQHEKWGKPHPQVFMTAATKLDVLPQNSVVLEDSFHGVIAGKAAKMKVIAVPDEHDRMDLGYGAADLVIDSLEELNEQKIQDLIMH